MRTSYQIRSIAAVAVAAISLSAVVALYAQQSDESPTEKAQEKALQFLKQAVQEAASDIDLTSEQSAGRFWIGISCEDVTPALKAQLHIEQGVVVGSVMPETPAAEAGLQQYDILLMMGDAEIASVDDVIQAIDKSEGKSVAVYLLRGGKKVGLTVTPRKRPDHFAENASEADSLKEERAKLERWIGNAGERAELSGLIGELAEAGEGKPLRRVIVLGEGAVVPKVKLQFAGFPSNTSLMITKKGDQPAHIVVKKDGKKYEATEDKLDGLPEEVRRLVAPLLGKQFGSADGVKTQPWIELRKPEASKKKPPEKGAVKEQKVDSPKEEAKNPAIKRENSIYRATPEGVRIEVREFKQADPKQGRIKVEIEPKQHKPAAIEGKAYPSKKAPEAKGAAAIERRLDEVLKRLDAIEKSLSRLRHDSDESAK